MAEQRKLFCEYNDFFYQLSVIKENLRRDIRDMRKSVSGVRFATGKMPGALPHVVKGHRSLMLRRLLGVDMIYQRGKVQNLRLAAQKLDGLVIRPGQVFSFWKNVGNPTESKGYRQGMVLRGGKPGHDVGGGLCQLANMVHWLVLHSPMLVTELHHHTDCIFPDERRRVPFGTGTSVFFKNVDYRFKNTSDRDVQLKIWVEDEYLCGELRAERPFDRLYRLVEEDHHFAYEGNMLYRNSRVYRLVYERESGCPCGKELLLNNHSEVLYDHALVDPAQIRPPVPVDGDAYAAG